MEDIKNCHIYYGNDSRFLEKASKNLEALSLKNNPHLSTLILEEVTQEDLISFLEENSLFGESYFVKIKKIKGSLKMKDVPLSHSPHLFFFCLDTPTNPIKSIPSSCEVKDFNLPKSYLLEKTIRDKFKNTFDGILISYIASSMKSILDLDDIEEKLKFYDLKHVSLNNYSLVLDGYEIGLFALSDYFFLKNDFSFIAAVNDFLKEEGSLETLLSLIYKKTKDLYTIKNSPKNAEILKESLNLPVFIINKYIKLAESYSLRMLERLLIQIVQTEFYLRFYEGNFQTYFIEKLFLDKERIPK